ncbi:hypothetical protein [uncultured Gemmiger sp.]|uniref:hypothetical protein n=1 Tax=uncultured Gemmiger sp. TaxID=1623490 RepID=UPI0025EAC30C|nr:hypothetical protein [uncultured Gemmiger sp.]
MRFLAKDRQRRARQAELAAVADALAENDRRFAQVQDPLIVEQLVYERAALMCHYRALLRDVRGGDTPCPSG